MSSVQFSIPFLLARDRGVGDYYHGRTINYYNVRNGHLVKREFENVLLWSNTTQDFDKELWKTFVPSTIKYVNDDGTTVVSNNQSSEYRRSLAADSHNVRCFAEYESVVTVIEKCGVNPKPAKKKPKQSHDVAISKGASRSVPKKKTVSKKRKAPVRGGKKK